MNWTRTTACALAAAASIGVAACGSDDDSDSSSSAPTKQEWITQADAICKSGDDKIDAQGKKYFSDPNADPEKFSTDVFVPTVQSELDDISALTPPAGDEEETAKIVDSAQAALDQISDDPASFEKGGQVFKETDQLAQAYGLKECGS